MYVGIIYYAHTYSKVCLDCMKVSKVKTLKINN